MLLPPKIQGPVNELSTFVIVLGAVDGATVQLFADGSAIGAPVTVSALSVSVSLGGARLAGGQSVTATQSTTFVRSPPSPAETVGAAPAVLPSLTFLSVLHTCVDWVLIGGMVAGAEASVFLKGSLVGKAIASGPILSVPVTITGAAIGDVLDVLQTYTLIGKPSVKGPLTHSLPLAAAPDGEPPAPVVTPPYECDMAVMVSGVLTGSSLILMHNTKELAGYPYAGSPVWANLDNPLAVTDTVRARQDFTGCHRQGGFSVPPTGVMPATGLLPPVIVGPICPSAPVLHVKSLRPGADVWVNVFKETNRGAIVKSELGHARAWAVDCEFPLPPNWADDPALRIDPKDVVKFYIQVAETNCSRPFVAEVPVQPLPSVLGIPEFHPKPVDCATLIVATGLTPGSVVTLHSDQSDFPQLSSPVSVSASTMVLYPYRPLRNPEFIWISQDGCSVSGDSVHVQVERLEALKVPGLETPIRQPRGGVWFRDLLVGGTLYVFYNGVPSIVVSITAERMFVFVPGMKVEDHIWGEQKFCTSYSHESNHETVIFGLMKISQQPSPIQRARVEAVMFTAVDTDTNESVSGSVRVNGSIVAGTGGTFPINVALGNAGPPSQVEALGYQSVGITWNLVNPPPPPPPPTTKLHLALQNQSGGRFGITSVVWTIWHQVGSAFTALPQVTGTAAVLTPPAAGQYLIHADVWAGRVATVTNELSEFRGIVTGPGGATSIVVVWGGADMTKTFKLVAEAQASTPGGPLDLYNPVVELIS